jgi:hypothetical protein
VSHRNAFHLVADAWLMTPDRLALLESTNTWCRNAEACNVDGVAVQYDPGAVRWDMTRALSCLFRWSRAWLPFEQLDRHIHGKAASSA